jgi:hypothetical protein
VEYGCHTHPADHLTYYGQADGDGDTDGNGDEEDRRAVGLVEDGRRNHSACPRRGNGQADGDSDADEEDRRVVGLVEDGRRTIRLVPDEPTVRRTGKATQRVKIAIIDPFWKLQHKINQI